MIAAFKQKMLSVCDAVAPALAVHIYVYFLKPCADFSYSNYTIRFIKQSTKLSLTSLCLAFPQMNIFTYESHL